MPGIMTAIISGGVLLVGPEAQGEEGQPLVSDGAGQLAFSDVPMDHISGLDTALAGKAGATHSHAQSDITGLTDALEAKADLVGGVVPSSQLPALVVTDVYTVADEAAMLALSAEQGDLAIRTDGAGTFIHTGGNAGDITDWSLLNAPTNVVTSVNGLIGNLVLTTEDVPEAGSTRYLTAAQKTALEAVAADIPGSLLVSTGGGLGVLHPEYAVEGDLPLLPPETSVIGINVDGTLRHVTGVAGGMVLKGQSRDAFAWDYLVTADISGLDTVLAGKAAIASNLSDLASARLACANLRTWYVLAMSHVASTPLTGTTAETAMASITIPGGALGPNGVIQVQVLATWTKSTNLKTVRIRYPGLGGESYYAPQISAATSGTTNGRPVLIRNRNNTGSQIGEARAVAVGGNQTDPVTSTADTTQDTSLVITGELANAGEQITIESYIVQILYGA